MEKTVTWEQRTRRGVLILIVLLICFPPRVHADGGAPDLAYVAGTDRGVGIIDVAKQQVVGTISIDGDPHTILLSPDGRFLYVTQPAVRHIAVLAAKTGQTICTASLPGHPTLLALNLDATVLYAAGNNEANITALDPATCKVRQTFQTTEPVYGLAVAVIAEGSSVSNQLWVAGTDAVTIFDEKGQALDSIAIAGGPQSISIPGDLTAYVTTRQGNVVAVDLGTHRAFLPLITGGKFGSIDYDAITGKIYVPDQQHNQLDVLTPVIADTALVPQEPAYVIHLSDPPQAIAITSDGQLGFVALSGGKVAMLDIPARHIVKTFFVGGTPHFIITGLYPPADVPLPVPQQAPDSGPDKSGLYIILIFVFIAVLFGTLWFLRGRRSR